MHQTQFSQKIPYGGFSQIRSHLILEIFCIVSSTDRVLYNYLSESIRSRRSVEVVNSTFMPYSRMIVGVLQVARNRTNGGSRVRHDFAPLAYNRLKQYPQTANSSRLQLVGHHFMHNEWAWLHANVTLHEKTKHIALESNLRYRPK